MSASNEINQAQQAWMDGVLTQVEQALSDWVAPTAPERLDEAMRYAVLDGGKRLRPLLVFAAAQAVGAQKDCPATLRAACAVELIHAYSLVHDDMPCMDNDDLRRGRATAHIVYGEANALLAGDALLNLAFELILDTLASASGEAVRTRLLKAGQAMAKRFGQQGMIGGQVIDLSSEGQKISLETLEEMDLKKTSALIEAAVLGGATAAGANQEELEYFTVFAQKLGLAFQIRDDILDCSPSSAAMGKTVGKDARDQKSTYVSLLGMTAAEERAEAATAAALAALDALAKSGCETGFLSDFAGALLKRDK